MAGSVHESPPLFRDTRRGYIGGVCAGLAEFAGIDVLYVRSAFVLATIFGGGDFRAVPIGLYLVLWLAAPKRPMAAAEVPKGVRYVALGLLAASALLIALSLDGDAGRLGGGVVAAPVAVAAAAAVIRRDTLAPRVLLVVLGMVASAVLFVLNFNPTFGNHYVQPQSMGEVGGHPYTSVAGDLTVDLTALDVSSGRIGVPVVAHFSEVKVIVPSDRNITVEENGSPLFTQRVGAGPELVIDVYLDGVRNSLEVVRFPPILQPGA
jgi:phage shock protein PspC (stress-responsive transcriptional regulator)